MGNTGTNSGAVITTDASASRTNLGLGTMSTVDSPIGPANAGTGLTSITTNAILIAKGSSNFIAIGPGTDGQVILAASGTTSPAWGTFGSSNGSITYTFGSGTIGMTITQATTSQVGGSALCTGAEAVTGTEATKALTPSTLTSRLAEPGTIGGTTPGSGKFTSITLNTTSGPTITTGSGAPAASAPLGSIYFRTNGTTTITRAYVNTNGSTTWTPLITVA